MNVQHVFDLVKARPHDTKISESLYTPSCAKCLIASYSAALCLLENGAQSLCL